MSNTPLPTCASITKWIFIIFNAIFALFGLALVGVGAWLLATGSAFSFLFNSNIIGGAALIVICGGVTFIIAAVGVIGAILQWRPVLVIFAACLTVIIILEIVGAILGFVFRGVVEQQFNESVTRAIQEYLADDSLRNLINSAQSTLGCCGANASSDWIGSPFYTQNNNQYPQSCCSNGTTCGPSAPGLHPNGCIPQAVSIIQQNIGYAIALGAVGLVIGLLEIAGVVLSMGLCICIHRSKLQLV
jgi:tetraspanin-7